MNKLDKLGRYNLIIHLVKITCSNPEVTVHKSLKDVVLNQSYLYLPIEQKDYCRLLVLNLDLPGWVSHELISQTLFGDKGVSDLRLAEKHHGQFFRMGSYV